jgi:hypothetical protein
VLRGYAKSKKQGVLAAVGLIRTILTMLSNAL